MSDPLIDAANAISDKSPAIKRYALLAAQRILALENPAPPPPPPPTTGAAWKWDARAATVAADSAAKITGWNGYRGPVYFAATVAVTFGTSDDSLVTLTGPGLDKDAHVPVGTQRGCSDDHHLVIADTATGRDHDLYGAAAVAGGWSAGGGASFPVGAVTEPGPSSSNAAAMSMRPSLIWPQEVAAGHIGHALTFWTPAPNIGGPSVYPANTRAASGPGSGLAFGQWLRLDPAVTVDAIAGLTAFERLVCHALQDFGMFLRDGSNGNTGIYLADTINQGGNGTAWPEVGVTLPNLANGYPYARQASSAMPWQRMQVLQPPSA